MTVVLLMPLSLEVTQRARYDFAASTALILFVSSPRGSVLAVIGFIGDVPPLPLESVLRQDATKSSRQQVKHNLNATEKFIWSFSFSATTSPVAYNALALHGVVESAFVRNGTKLTNRYSKSAKSSVLVLLRYGSHYCPKGISAGTSQLTGP